MNAEIVAGSRRTAWLGLLCLLVVAAGAVLGWRSTVPIFRSEGLLVLDPTRVAPSGCGPRETPYHRNDFMDVQVAFLRDERVLREAILTEGMKSLSMSDAGSLARLREGLRIEWPGRGLVVTVACEDEAADFAAAAVAATMSSYLALSQFDRSERSRKRLDQLQEMERQMQTQIDAYAAMILGRVERYGSAEGLRALYDRAIARFAERDVALTLAEERARGETEGAPAHAEWTLLEIQVRTLRSRINELAAVVGQLEIYERRTRESQARRAELARQIDDIRTDLRRPGPLLALSHGARPDAPFRDRRPRRAVLGGLAGFGLVGFLGAARWLRRRRRGA